MTKRSGAVLLETIVALAIVMGVAAYSLRVVDDAESSLDRADRRRRCMDAAASITSMIDAGLLGIADLRSTKLPEVDGASLGGGDGYELEMAIETTRTAWSGIVECRVTISEQGTDPVQATLVELVRLYERLGEAFTTDELLEGLP